MKLSALVVVTVASIGLVVPALASDSAEVVRLASPAPEASLTGNLVTSEDGLYLSWLEQRPQGHALRFAIWDGETFNEPRFDEMTRVVEHLLEVRQ